MEDHEIVRLYWDRCPDAISAASEKYGNYCRSIAQNILGNREDAEECVNDTWLNAWNAIPPHRPGVLSAFLGKLTRNLSFNRYQRDHAAKRGRSELALVLDELADCVPATDTVEQELDRAELIRAINAFLRELPAQKRGVFVRRYWYAAPIADIAGQYRMTAGAVSMTLSRTRKQLRTYLLERGFSL